MAIWQVEFYILPNQQNIKLFENINLDNFDEAKFWGSRRTSSDFFSKVATFLPRNNSWSKDLEVFGKFNSNVFEVYAENKIVESVSFRIDFTTDYITIILSIINFCDENNFVILDYNFKNTFNNFEIIVNSINTSPSIRNYLVLSNSTIKS